MTTTRRPVYSVRLLAWGVLALGLTGYAATADATDPTPLTIGPSHTETLMAEHECGADVTSGATGVIVDEAGTATYKAGQAAVDAAYAGYLDGSVTVVAFCRG